MIQIATVIGTGIVIMMVCIGVWVAVGARITTMTEAAESMIEAMTPG